MSVFQIWCPLPSPDGDLEFSPVWSRCSKLNSYILISCMKMCSIILVYSWWPRPVVKHWGSPLLSLISKCRCTWGIWNLSYLLPSTSIIKYEKLALALITSVRRCLSMLLALMNSFILTPMVTYCLHCVVWIKLFQKFKHACWMSWETKCH